MLSLLALAAAVSDVPSCPGISTLEVNACLGRRFRDSDAVLNRYYLSALKRIGRDDHGNTRKEFIRAERAWVAYRDSECGSVFNYWKGGTIRVSMEIDCDIRLTELRTFTIWLNWLTYPDGTPPLLPRPNVESATRARSGT
jgi:uncharacterized protein YecT (DUF1311 family)